MTTQIIFANGYKVFGGTTAEWAAHDDPLYYRELGIEYTDDGRVLMKAGIKTEDDSPTPWSQLPYIYGKKGDIGPEGPSPDFEWDGTNIRFKKPDGTWGVWVDLKGPKGDKGDSPEIAGSAYLILDDKAYTDEEVRDAVEALDLPDGTICSVWFGDPGTDGDESTPGPSSPSVDILFADYQRMALFTSNKTTVTVHAPLRVKIGLGVYTLLSSVTLDLAVAGTAEARKGRDVYLYACAPDSGTAPTFVLSMNSTVPSGYTADNSRKIGGFHCVCADIGNVIPTSEIGTQLEDSEIVVNGLVAGDILPDSVWDLRFRPYSESEGMVFCKRLNLWVDIYLGTWTPVSEMPEGWTRARIRSSYGGNYSSITTGANSISGEGWDTYASKVKKRLPSRFEFVNFSMNSNNGTNIQGSINPSVTGGHVDTAGRRMVSYIGVEDCVGLLWQWVSDLFEGGSYGSIQNNNHALIGYGWNMGENTVSHSGSCHGFLRRAVVGGSWSFGSYCGRRAVSFQDMSARTAVNIGGRGVSEPREILN